VTGRAPQGAVHERELQRAVGRNLRRYRQAMGLSQDLIGVHRTHASAVEGGRRNLTLGSLERVNGDAP
jgi:transcriptional regulator with XRE-family HTH domain